MKNEPVAVILAVAVAINAVLTVAAPRVGLSSVEVGTLTAAVTALATAYARSKVTPTL